MHDLPARPRQLIDAIVDGIPINGAADELATLMDRATNRERSVLLFYWDSRREGTSPKLAEMLALMAPPQSKTDVEFLKGFGANGAQFAAGPMANNHGDRYKRVAERGGQNTVGKVYLGSLARYPGDPEAWVSGRGDVQAVCERRGWRCTGDVEVKETGRVNEVDAAFRERKTMPSPGLDMDEDGKVETLHDGADGRQKIDESIARPELVEKRA